MRVERTINPDALWQGGASRMVGFEPTRFAVNSDALPTELHTPSPVKEHLTTYT